MRQIKHLKLFFFSILLVLGTLANTMHFHDLHEDEVHQCDICIVDHLNLSFDVIDKKSFLPLEFVYEFEVKPTHIVSREIYNNTQARAPPHTS